MTTNADHFKNLRNVLLAERERLGITVSRDGIGAPSSSGPINAGMSEALEQLVLLAQLHAGRTEDNTTRGYSEANIALVRQYMKDRGVGQDRNDLFTGTIQALDTVTSGQQKSVFDQQYVMGGTDLALFRMQNEALLRGTSKTAAVPAARPLTALFQQAGSGTASPQPAAATPPAPAAAQPTAVPEVPMKRVSLSYSYDQIQELKQRTNKTAEELAVLKVWDQQWAKYSGEKGFSAVDDRFKKALNTFNTRGQDQTDMFRQAGNLRTENARLLERIKDMPITINVAGGSMTTTWNKIYAEVGWLELNDDARETEMRRAGLKALEDLKVSQGYDARTQEIANLSNRAANHFITTERELRTAGGARSTQWSDIRNDPISINVMVPNFDAMNAEQRQSVAQNGVERFLTASVAAAPR
ncbi:MAG: hypothetical protein KA099_09440 [Alphaproteobacteria bacterium]|nr:hypothetical protein [Alphaproteobacteria bacterium]MBP7758539.1 hypothetical protein [Alphaproteobacteria bacterium]MBP7761972.1 hypothetical protein [Alphaproteobacteria bacterium]MBP7905536.1 hypothetical protein [Alphaproteobacteria bacterium]